MPVVLSASVPTCRTLAPEVRGEARTGALHTLIRERKRAVDFIAFRDALHQADYDGWATVEQDMYPAPFDKPLPIAKRTRAYLRAIELG